MILPAASYMDTAGPRTDPQLLPPQPRACGCPQLFLPLTLALQAAVHICSSEPSSEHYISP
eukprot:4278418-Pyramimonas_sp.AAC.1